MSQPQDWVEQSENVKEIQSFNAPKFQEASGLLQQAITVLKESPPESTSSERLHWVIHRAQAHLANFSIVQQSLDLDKALELSTEMYRLRREAASQQESVVSWSIFLIFPSQLWQAVSSTVWGSAKGLKEGHPLTTFSHSLETAELDIAVDSGRQVLKSSPASEGDALITLASSLFVRFNVLRKMQDLEETISFCRKAIHLHMTPPRRLLCLNILSAALLARYIETNGIQSLHDSRALRVDAVKGEREHLEYQTLIAGISQSRSEGRARALDKAVSLYREVLALRPPPHPHRAISLHNLATSLYTRFLEGSQRRDLDEAIALYRDALSLLPDDHPDRETTATYLNHAFSAQSKLE